VFTNPRPAASVLTNSFEDDYGEVHEDPVLLAQRRAMWELEKKEILRRTAGLGGAQVPGPQDGHGSGTPNGVLTPSPLPRPSASGEGNDNGSIPRLLDVGCGTGEFLARLGEHFEVYGTDVSRRYLALAQERYGLPHLHAGRLPEAGFAPDFFDVVQVRGVLQVSPDPAALLREAFRITRPGGLLIVSATPNIESPAARVFKGNFRMMAPDLMVYDFSPGTLRRMVEQAGYRVEGFSFPYVGTPYFRWYQGAEFAWRAGKLWVRRALRKSTEGIRSPAFWGSMMTCYARKA
jgi:SAM-dependent methyltransferase